MLFILLLFILPWSSAEVSVSCQHVKNLQERSDPSNSTTRILQKCLDQVDQVKKYDYRDLHLSCEDVFGSTNLTKLTTSLVKDYLRCEKDGYTSRSVNDTFNDFLRVFVQGRLMLRQMGTLGCFRNIERMKKICFEWITIITLKKMYLIKRGWKKIVRVLRS